VSVLPKSVDAARIRILLLDIEGTTTPIDFVYKTLFPYAESKLETFLVQHSADEEIESLLRDLKVQHSVDQASGLQPPAWLTHSAELATGSAVGYVRWLMSKDSKCTPLKFLQGKIWRQGFEAGELHGEVYDDVPPAFARWRRQGRGICIYSSGSVLAQQLLFRTVPAGDLTQNISAFFDTQIGAKADPESYRRIAASLGRKPDEILFLSDAAKETEAAAAAGMPALLCDRNATSVKTAAVKTFDEIFSD
jgi:enolase-phosphatase E1